MKQTIRRKIEPKLFISFSSYKTFKNCPELYRQNYLITSEEQEDTFVAFDSYEASVGSAVQAVFEHLINKNISMDNLEYIKKTIDNDILILADLLVPLERYTFANRKVYIDENKIITKFEQFAVDITETSLRQLRRKFISEVATMYRKPLIKMNELYNLSKMSSEVKLQVEYKDFILGGRLDFIHYMDKAHIEIIDGKRQYNPQWIDKEQILMYGIMGAKALNRKIKKLGYWDWSTNKITHIDFTDKDLKETFDNIKKFQVNLKESIKTNRFRKKKGFYCKWCPIKDSCEKYNTEPTSKGEFETL